MLGQCFTHIPMFTSFLVILMGGAVHAEDTASPRGLWEAPCAAWGMAATCRTEWSSGMHDSHTVQTYSIVNAETGDVLFAGRGLYRVDGEQVTGYWEDTTGSVHPLQGSWVSGIFEVIWGTPETEVGRSVYTFNEGELDVVDSVQTDAGWRDFMTVSYGGQE